MKYTNKKIWEYKKKNEAHCIRIFERKDNILIIENDGTAFLEGCEKAFNFVLEHAKSTNTSALILLDNTHLHMIDSSTKILFLRFQEANNHIKKIATIGNNAFVQQFGKIYQYTCHFTFRIRSFKNKNIALIWLKCKEGR